MSEFLHGLLSFQSKAICLIYIVGNNYYHYNAILTNSSLFAYYSHVLNYKYGLQSVLMVGNTEQGLMLHPYGLFEHISKNKLLIYVYVLAYH